MSARSCCVTCGIVAQAALRCSAVLRRTARIGWRSISPQRVKSGSGSTRRRRRRRRRADEPLGVRLHVLDRNPAAGTAAGHLVDVDAELARHAAHRRRRRRRRQSRARRRRFGRRSRAAVDVDDLPVVLRRRCAFAALIATEAGRPLVVRRLACGPALRSFTPALSGLVDLSCACTSGCMSAFRPRRSLGVRLRRFLARRRALPASASARLRLRRRFRAVFGRPPSSRPVFARPASPAVGFAARPSAFAGRFAASARRRLRP